jgi:hypothetical protein
MILSMTVSGFECIAGNRSAVSGQRVGNHLPVSPEDAGIAENNEGVDWH